VAIVNAFVQVLAEASGPRDICWRLDPANIAHAIYSTSLCISGILQIAVLLRHHQSVATDWDTLATIWLVWIGLVALGNTCAEKTALRVVTLCVLVAVMSLDRLFSSSRDSGGAFIHIVTDKERSIAQVFFLPSHFAYASVQAGAACSRSIGVLRARRALSAPVSYYILVFTKTAIITPSRQRFRFVDTVLSQWACLQINTNRIPIGSLFFVLTIGTFRANSYVEVYDSILLAV